MIQMNIKTYSELVKIQTFEDRYKYLKLNGKVCEETFGFDRYINQTFYKSREWRSIRDYVIVRDNGCDLAMLDREINGFIFIHHMNPISKDDIVRKSKFILNPEFLICVSKRTHDAIHYGDIHLLEMDLIERKPNDTCPWKGGVL